MIEELCVEVGVLWCIFFNYFESKENVVFGFVMVDFCQEEFEEEFVVVCGDIIEDFVWLMVCCFELFNLVDDVLVLFVVIEYELCLFKVVFEQIVKNEQCDRDFIFWCFDDDDVFFCVEVIVYIVGVLVWMSMDQFVYYQLIVFFVDYMMRCFVFVCLFYVLLQKVD